MTIQYYDSPFHVTEAPDIASKSVLKTDLMILIRDEIEQEGWTQMEAADHLEISQPRISDIKNGKIDKFTLDALFSILDDLGFTTEFATGGVKESMICIKKHEAA